MPCSQSAGRIRRPFLQLNWRSLSRRGATRVHRYRRRPTQLEEIFTQTADQALVMVEYVVRQHRLRCPHVVRDRSRTLPMAAEQEAEWGFPGVTHRLFAAALARLGGPERALLVGELWERGPSRELLQGFSRDVFSGTQEEKDIPPRLQGSPRELSPTRRLVANPRAPPCRSLGSPLVFVLFRLSSVQSPGERRRLREILRDVRERSRGRESAVVGVIVLPGEPLGALEPTAVARKPTASPLGDPKPASAPLGALEPLVDSAPLGVLEPHSPSPSMGTHCLSPGPTNVSSPISALEPPSASAPLGAPEPLLLALLSSVFLPAGPLLQPPAESPLQTALYRPGDPHTALEVKRAACRALRASNAHPDVNAEDGQKIPTILKCFPWRRRRRKGHSLKAGSIVTGEIPHHPEEGTALKALYNLSNGNCEENHTDT